MQTAANWPISRPDTLLGVCHALGDDFGFNPLWLRLAFAGGLFWAPAMVIGAYLGLGALIYLSRWIFPDVRAVAVQADAPPALSAEAQPEMVEERLPIAA